MTSPRGVAAAVVFLCAFPVALLYQAAVGAGASAVLHIAFALGSMLMAAAVFDFRTTRWINWAGCLSIGALGVIFLLQGLSELIPDPTLTAVAYQALGQGTEGRLGQLFLLWCVAALLMDSHGKTKALGAMALAIAVCVEVYALVLAYRGTLLNVQAPMLRLLSLLPFVWLLVRSWATRSVCRV